MILIGRLLSVTLAAAALLVGIQAPNFVDQYRKRLDAHLIEVRVNLKPFQDIADRLHGGSMAALIAQHRSSQDASFQAEGDAILRLQDRFLRFQNEAIELQTDLARQLLWMASRADRELLDETRRNYSFGILLDRGAVIAGFSCMILVVILLELVAGLLRLLRLNRQGATRP